MRALVVGMMGCVVACGDGEVRDTVSIPRDRIDERFAALQCQMLSQCTLAGDAAVFGAFVDASDQAACEAFVMRVLERDGRDLEGRVARGELEYDGGQLALCFALALTTCNLDENVALCEQAFEGRVALGGACEGDLDCAGDATCRPSGDAECGGVCEARVVQGGACEFDSDCSRLGTALTCSEGSCIPTRAEVGVVEGARCGEARLDGEWVIRTCAEGLVCVEDLVGGQTSCRAPLAAGAECAGVDLPCERGYACQPAGEDRGTCQVITIVSEVDQACNLDLEAGALVVCSLVDQLGCDDGKCRRWGNGTSGQYCSLEFETEYSCDRGLYCDGATCQPLKAEDAACTLDSECLSGFCDGNGASGVCREAQCD